MGLSNIQWTDYTYNPWRGCRKVAPECANCYIVTTTPFRVVGQKHGSERVRAGEATLRSPLAWNRKAADNAEFFPRRARPRVFCLSLGDWLDDENVPIEWFADLLETIDRTPHLDYLLLTKRPQNWRNRIAAAVKCMNLRGQVGLWRMMAWRDGTPPANVWIGVSAGADQAAALDIPARVHFLSCEPMLHALDTTRAARFDWIIFGGESGKNARIVKDSWIREGVRFCRENGVAPFVKQLGANIETNGIQRPGEYWPPGTARVDIGGKWRVKLNDSHGGDMAEWPIDLRVRQFPTPRA